MAVLGHEHEPAELEELLVGFFPVLPSGKSEQGLQTWIVSGGDWRRTVAPGILDLFPTLLQTLERSQQTKKLSRDLSWQTAPSSIARLQVGHGGQTVTRTARQRS